jgi:hypothetical protein
LQRRPRRSAVEERAVLETEEQPDPARGGLRAEVAAEIALLVDELEDLAVQLLVRRCSARARTSRAERFAG